MTGRRRVRAREKSTSALGNGAMGVVCIGLLTAKEGNTTRCSCTVSVDTILCSGTDSGGTAATTLCSRMDSVVPPAFVFGQKPERLDGGRAQCRSPEVGLLARCWKAERKRKVKVKVRSAAKQGLRDLLREWGEEPRR
jgi:hypothetical protein